MKPKIESRAAFSVVGMKYRGRNENQEIAQLWGEFMPRIAEIKRPLNDGFTYGAMANYDEESGLFDYLAAIAVENIEDIPEDMEGWDIPAQEYAVFTATLPKIMEAYNFAYKEWLPASEYEYNQGYEFEAYGQEFSPEDPESVFFIYMPVVKK